MAVKKDLDLSKFRILVVEDFPFISELISSSLKEMGVGEVFKAENGEIGKERILNFNAVSSSTNIDVVVLDWLMPVMNGRELLRWIRSHKLDSIKFLPVIICSAYTSRDMVNSIRKEGANEAMVKPVAAAKLAARIKSVIDSPRPFIKTEDFFGPDRRRQELKYEGKEKRIAKTEDLEVNVEELE